MTSRGRNVSSSPQLRLGAEWVGAGPGGCKLVSRRLSDAPAAPDLVSELNPFRDADLRRRPRSEGGDPGQPLGREERLLWNARRTGAGRLCRAQSADTFGGGRRPAQLLDAADGRHGGG